MRFVVIGAGAIGGVVGGFLHLAGEDVTLVARGAHREVLERDGLVLQTPTAEHRLGMPVAASAAEVAWEEGTVALLAVKSQDTEAALAPLVDVAPVTTPVVCMQNGVENERRVLRRFPTTLAMCVMCPATHLRPGIVQASSAPVPGLLDLGRYPDGVDDTTRAIAAALGAAGFASVARADIMRWKYRKLCMNLLNALEALCGPWRSGGAAPGDPERAADEAAKAELAARAVAEGEAVLAAAGIAVVSVDEDRERRGDLLSLSRVAGERREGGSSWQSLARGTGSIETDFLNGEITLLGRLHGVPTPANDVLGHLAARAAAAGEPPGQHRAAEIARAVERAAAG